MHLKVYSPLSNGMFFKYQFSLLSPLCYFSVDTRVVLLKSSSTIVLLFPLLLLLAFALHIEDLLCGCVYIYNVYIFFLDQSCDHYVVLFFVSCNCLYFKIYFSHIILILQLSSDFLCEEYLFPSPPRPHTIFNFYVSLGLKLVSCTQYICGSGFCTINQYMFFWLEHLIHLHLR